MLPRQPIDSPRIYDESRTLILVGMREVSSASHVAISGARLLYMSELRLMTAFKTVNSRVRFVSLSAHKGRMMPHHRMPSAIAGDREFSAPASGERHVSHLSPEHRITEE
jgi:hypothetical protein